MNVNSPLGTHPRHQAEPLWPPPLIDN